MANEKLKRVIGDNVRRFRDQTTFSQADLAELVGRDASSIAHMIKVSKAIFSKLRF